MRRDRARGPARDRSHPDPAAPRRLCATLAAALALLGALAARPADAVVGVADVVPAATLLVPHFAVDLDDPAGLTTVVGIRNASDSATIANVTLWTDLGLPTQAFVVGLAPWDVESINLRDLFTTGTVPATTSTHPSCDGVLPYPTPLLGAAALTDLAAAHRGLPAPTYFPAGTCGAVPTGDAIARGYVTIDVVRMCGAFHPRTPGYFAANGTGTATDDNRLLGTWQLVDPANNFAGAENAVHVEASSALGVPGDYTFYGALPDVAFTATDDREALPTIWAVHYASADDELLVWRDTFATAIPVGCGTLPSFYPLESLQLVQFDAEANAVELDTLALPARTNRVRVGQIAPFPGSPAFDAREGWIYLNLNAPGEPPLRQSWATAVRAPEGSGLHSAMVGAVAAAYPKEGVSGLGADDPRPAATLLLPYFEVPLADPSGPVWSMRVGNFDASPHLAHVTLWTDLGVPTLGFDVYLAGYDTVEIDLRLVLAGILPQTAHDVTNQSQFGNPPVEFPGCGEHLLQGRLPPETIAGLRDAHTGQASDLFGGLCAGAPTGDGVARGYVTVDLTVECTAGPPSAPGYFAPDGTGRAGNGNHLWGEYVVVERGQNFAWAERLVHLEAADALGSQDVYTFYGRHLAGSGADDREPLGGTWQGPYVAGAFDAGTDVIVWRDTGSREAFACGAGPQPLRQREVTPFDETGENADLRLGFPLGFDQRFPIAADRVNLRDAARLPIPFDAGALHLGLDFPGSSPAPPFGVVNQAHATFVHRAAGRFAGGHAGAVVDGVIFFPTP